MRYLRSLCAVLLALVCMSSYAHAQGASPYIAHLRCNRMAESYTRDVRLIPAPAYGTGYMTLPSDVGVPGVLVGTFNNINVSMDMIVRPGKTSMGVYWVAKYLNSNTNSSFEAVDSALGGPAVINLSFSGNQFQLYGAAFDGQGSIGCQIRFSRE